MARSICTIAGCDDPIVGKGLCDLHYRRKRSGTPMDAPRRSYNTQNGKCSMAGCDRQARSRGFCMSHYRRDLERRGGSDCPPRNSAPIGSKRLANGYVRVKCSTGWVFEHRMVMEAAIGRPLTADEIVHHRDGDKQNNAIQNLELCSNLRQPPRQRLKDQLAQAQAMLEANGFEVRVAAG